MKNWKTTLLGAVGAIFTVCWPLIESGSLDLKTLATAAAIALFGYLSKDAGVTGVAK